MSRTFRLLPIVILAMIAAACADPPMSAEESARVDEVIERYVEAAGGLEAIRGIQSLKKSGIYAYNGLEHAVVVFQKRDNSLREEVDGLQQYGTSTASGVVAIRAYDGTEAWIGSRAETLESEPMPATDVAGFVQDATIESPLVNYKEKGHRISLVGAADLEGIATIQLDLTLADGGKQSWYLDAETYLPVMKSTEFDEGEFLTARTWYLDDYRDVSGVQMPFFVQVEEMVFARDYIFDTIEANVEIDDDLFVRPEGG